MRRFDDDRTENPQNKEFMDYLKFKPEEINVWVADYLKFNFAHYNLTLINLARTINYIMENDLTEKYLVLEKDFDYNNTHDLVRTF